MKKLLLIIFTLSCFFVDGQILQKDITYGREMNRLLIDSLMGLPSDTLTVPTNLRGYPWLSIKSDTAYLWSSAQAKWIVLTVSGSGFNNNATELLDGGQVVYSGTGLKFYITPSIYRIEGVIYGTLQDSVTLSASDPDDPRKDVIYLATTGVEVLTGTPAGPAAEPQLDADQIKLTVVDVPALATTPGITQQVLYDENTESTVTGFGVVVNPASTTDVYRLTVAIDIGTLSNADVITLDAALPTLAWDLTGVNSLDGFIKLKAVMPPEGRLRIQLFNGSTAISAEVNLVINKSFLGWQPFSIPVSAFGNLTSLSFTRVRIRYNTTVGNYAGFTLDYTYLQDGIVQPGPGGGVNSVTLQGPAGWTFTGPTTGDVIQTIIPGGTSTQILGGDGVVKTDSSVKYIGTINSLTKSSNGAVINTLTNEIVLQEADADDNGLLSEYDWRRLDTIANQTIENGDNTLDTLVYAIDEFRTAVKSIKDSTGIGVIDRGGYLAIYNTGGGGGSTLHGSEFTSSNDTLYLGGGRQAYDIVNVIPNSRATDHQKTAMFFTNRGGDSNRFVTNFHHAVRAQDGTYEPVLARFSRRYEEAWNDTLNNLLYGAATESATWNGYDSSSTRFRYDNKPIRIPTGGSHFLQDVFLPRDSVHWEANRDGQSASVIKNDLLVGATWGYNVKIVPFSDWYPINSVQSSLELIRNIDNTRKKTMNGPITNYVGQWKAYQTQITSSTTEVGNYWSHISDFTSFGDLYGLNIAHSSATKAKVLAVATVDSAFGFISRPKYRVKNQVKNGYGLAIYGIYDRSFIEGKLRVGTYAENNKIPGIDSAMQTLSVVGSLSVTDSVFHKKDILATDTTNAYIGLYDKTSGLLKKINPYQLGLGGTLQQVFSTQSNNAQLTANDTITTASRFVLNSTVADYALKINNTANGGLTVAGNTYGIFSSASAGTALGAYATGSQAADIRTTRTSNNTIESIAALYRQNNTFVGADGIGGSLDFFTNHSTGVSESSSIVSKYTNATAATRIAQMDITLDSIGVETIAMNIQNSGVVRVNNNADTLATKADVRSGVGGGGMINPMTTSQDIIVGGASGTPTRLAVGTNGQRLGVSAGNVTWVDNDATWNGLFLQTLQTASTSVTLSTHGLYTYVGTADATFTLPALSSNLNRMYYIKNSSAFVVTVQRAGSDNLFTTSSVTSIAIPAGSSVMIGGTTASGTSYWHVMDLAEGSGGTPSLTQYRLAVGDASNLISDAAAITANRALISDANGVPTHSATTATELGYVNGVTSAIQTQLNNKTFTIPVLSLSSGTINDAATQYFGNFPAVWQTSATIYEITIDKACTLIGAMVESQCSTAGSNEDWTMYVRVNNTTDYTISTLGVTTNRRSWTNSAINTTGVALVAGDKVVIKSINPTWGTNPGTCINSGYLRFIEN